MFQYDAEFLFRLVYVQWGRYLIWHPWAPLKDFYHHQINAWANALKTSLTLEVFPPVEVVREFVKTGILFNFLHSVPAKIIGGMIARAGMAVPPYKNDYIASYVFICFCYNLTFISNLPGWNTNSCSRTHIWRNIC